MMPATHVPWPLSSDAPVSLLTKSYPFATRPRRSRCPDWTPVSRTATRFEPPVDRFHASRTRIRSSEYWPPVCGSLTATPAIAPPGGRPPPTRTLVGFGQGEEVVRLRVRDRRVGHQLGDDRLHRAPSGREDQRRGHPARGVPSSVTRSSPRARSIDRPTLRVAPTDDDLAGHDLSGERLHRSAWHRPRPRPAARRRSRREQGRRWRGLGTRMGELQCGSDRIGAAAAGGPLGRTNPTERPERATT